MDGHFAKPPAEYLTAISDDQGLRAGSALIDRQDGHAHTLPALSVGNGKKLSN